jgi:hypothetical protein
MDEFCAITGVDADTSAMYMEMSGYDLDTAIQLFFSMSDGGGAGGGGTGDSASSAVASSTGWPHDWISLLFSSSSGSSSIPDAWLHQGLQTASPEGAAPHDWSQLSILQHKNGPCGVLAAYQGYLLAHLLQNQTLTPSYSPTPEDATAAVMRLLQTVATASTSSPPSLKYCSWTDPSGGVGGSVITAEGDATAAATQAGIQGVIAQYLAPGGVLLLLYSVLQTFGVDTLQQQHSSLLPLLYGPNSLCTSALMNILLTGEARESLGAYDDFGAAVSWNKPPALVGLLSGTEIELKMKIHDGFKFPREEVYVLHGRDHFTTLLALPSVPPPAPLPFREDASSGDTSAAAAVSFVGVHFNGLPPAGPAVSQVMCCDVLCCMCCMCCM